MMGRRDPADKARIAALKLRIGAGTATARDCVVFNILRGWPAWFGFQPYTNPAGLRNGRDPYAGFMRATSASGYEGIHPDLVAELTPEQLSSLRLARSKLAVQAFEAAVAAGVIGPTLRGFLNRAMKATPQGSVSVWKHCMQTRIAANKLTMVRNGYLARTAAPAWVPEWFFTAPKLELTRDGRATLWRYLEHHDCGKPFVVIEDETGRSHFPGHADKSAEIWRLVGGSAVEARLMARDMELHTMSADAVPTFAADPDAPLLLVAALGSLWANAADFGGVASSSFKMKLKHLDRRGRAICKVWEAAAEVKSSAALALA
jgi:hypothetical protein